jgi:SAP domain-containing ribonucleoprotein
MAYDDMTVEELKDELYNRDLPVSGNKAELVARLEEADAPKAEPTESVTVGSDAEVSVDYASDDTIAAALALEEPLRGVASSLASGPNVDAVKAAVRNAAHGIAHIRKALDANARVAER